MVPAARTARTKNTNTSTMKSIANFAAVRLTVQVARTVRQKSTATVTGRTSAFGAVPHQPAEAVLTARPESMKDNCYHSARYQMRAEKIIKKTT